MSIKISFHTNFSKFFHEIFLVENNNIDYYDNSHMNYIYTYKIDRILSNNICNTIIFTNYNIYIN